MRGGDLGARGHKPGDVLIMMGKGRVSGSGAVGGGKIAFHVMVLCIRWEVAAVVSIAMGQEGSG